MDHDYVDLALNVEVPCYNHQNCLPEDKVGHFACPAAQVFEKQKLVVTTSEMRLGWDEYIDRI
jgi:hypothetical protein